MIYSERYKEVRLSLALTQEEFDKELLLKKDKSKNIETGKHKISIELAKEIEQKYSFYGWWLLTGEGEKKINKNNYPQKEEKSLISVKDELIPVRNYSNVYGSAGQGVVNFDSKFTTIHMDKRILTKTFNVRNFNNLDMIKVQGCSMMPTINDGEIIFIERDTPPENGDTIVALLEGELYIKRLKKIPFSKWIILESENSDYPNISIDTNEKMEELEIMGVVRSSIQVKVY